MYFCPRLQQALWCRSFILSHTVMMVFLYSVMHVGWTVFYFKVSSCDFYQTIRSFCLYNLCDLRYSFFPCGACNVMYSFKVTNCYSPFANRVRFYSELAWWRIIFGFRCGDEDIEILTEVPRPMHDWYWHLLWT